MRHESLVCMHEYKRSWHLVNRVVHLVDKIVSGMREKAQRGSYLRGPCRSRRNGAAFLLWRSVLQQQQQSVSGRIVLCMHYKESIQAVCVMSYWFFDTQEHSGGGALRH
jgi:hypothetical protein